MVRASHNKKERVILQLLGGVKWWFQRMIARLTPLESSVLKSVIAALPESEGQAIDAQIRAALFDRQMGSRVITFRFPEKLPTSPIERLVAKGRLVLAVVKVRGHASRFTTTAKVSLSHGLLAELSFDLTPWSGSENFDTECELVGCPGSRPTD